MDRQLTRDQFAHWQMVELPGTLGHFRVQMIRGGAAVITPTSSHSMAFLNGWLAGWSMRDAAERDLEAPAK